MRSSGAGPDDFVRPNGLAFSRDERLLYIVDTRQSPSHIRVLMPNPESLVAARRQGVVTRSRSGACARSGLRSL
jgi:sugar lactone lactonase YvrE